MRQLIKRILKEEREKDLSPKIKKLLKDGVVPNHKMICTVDVVAPDKMYDDPTGRNYQVMVSVIGGLGSKHWPMTQSVRSSRDNIVNDVWHTIYDYMGLSTDVFLRNVKSCDEVLTEELHEYFTFDDLKKGYDYYINLDKKKHPGADSFDRYKMIKAFQKWVDLIYKYTSKEVFFDGVDGMNVGTVWQDKWGENFSRPEDKISRMNYTVRVFPNIDKSNPPESKEQFEEDYEKFKEVFQKVADGIGIDYIDPVADKRARNAKVVFDFLKVGDSQLNTQKGLVETELTERCWKGYTQKGMKTMFGKKYPNCVKIKK